MITGINFTLTAKFGRGFYIGHFGQIIISPSAIIGEYYNISKGVTISQRGRDRSQLVPMIGDRMYIRPESKISRTIRIGNDVVFGANTVDTKDLPDIAMEEGVPATVFNLDSSRDFVNFIFRNVSEP